MSWGENINASNGAYSLFIFISLHFGLIRCFLLYGHYQYLCTLFIFGSFCFLFNNNEFGVNLMILMNSITIPEVEVWHPNHASIIYYRIHIYTSFTIITLIYLVFIFIFFFFLDLLQAD